MINIIRRLKIEDMFSPIIFLILLPLTIVLRIYFRIIKRKIILICEDSNQARDNGYDLYVYLITHGYKDVYYAINKNSPDKKKFIQFGKTINYGSIQHWIYYLTAFRNVSIHKAGSPSPAFFYVLHKYRLFNGNRVFLQHGVTMNNVKYLHKSECNFKYFITAANEEHNFIINNFGYTEKQVKLLGFSRFDNLLDYKQNGKIKIAIMPTWRKYLVNLSNEDFINSNFYKGWNGLLTNHQFKSYLKNNNIHCIFYPHRNLFKYLNTFQSNDYIKVADPYVEDIKLVIKDYDVLITDYSSISVDFAYTGKPLFYYQFDESEFRENHLEEGYFSYQNDGFGPILGNNEDLLNHLEELKSNKFQINQEFLNRRQQFFKYIDKNNNERIAKLLYE